MDDIDPQGKVSLSLAGEAPESDGPSARPVPVASSVGAAPRSAESSAGQVSFEDSWEAEAVATFGDLGPAQTAAVGDRGGPEGDRGPRRNPRPPSSLIRPEPVTFRRSTLDSGLTVVTERMPDVRSVCLGFWVGTGSVDEAPAQAGASHFLEHLLFKGTAERSARSIAEAVDSVGGDMNAFTTKEYTTFYVRLLADVVDMGIDLMSDIIWSPAFRSDEFESERQVILEEILMHADEPADLVHDLLVEALFPDHPLGREVLGEHATRVRP